MAEPLGNLRKVYITKPEGLADMAKRQLVIAASPITRYPQHYMDLNQEARDQMARGIGQLRNSVASPADAFWGAGNLALGGLGYVSSPVDAAVRSLIGQPLQDTAGIPREITETAAQMLGPGAFAKLRGGGYKVPHGQITEPIAAAPAGDVGSGLAGASGGDEGVRQAALQAERRANGRQPLGGLPTGPQNVDGEHFVPGPVGAAHDVHDAYMADKDFGVLPPDKYHPIDPEHAKKIAAAYDDMPMWSNDPLVHASYDAMINETMAQYRAIKDSGLKITPTDVESYPYKNNPRAVAKDVADNNHMAFFKTSEGFGSGNDAAHPLLKPSGEKIGDYELLNNDLFRIVHDYFGHIKNGYGFRAAGEDNAWRSHAAMYSPDARPAMTTETRGQNSWLNYGPHGEANRTASAADTVYAPQKIGLLPDWVMNGLEQTKDAAQ